VRRVDIERIAISAGVPLRIWLVTVSDPAKEDVKCNVLTMFQFPLLQQSLDRFAFSNDSFMIEKP